MRTREGWTTLSNLNHSTTLSNVFRLTIKFNTLTDQPGQSALAFINQAVAAANQLKDLGEDVSKQKIKFQILGHLRPEFD